jgi:hypothetical protein
MEDTFVLKIQLGNDAMQSGFEVAAALRATANKIEKSPHGHTEMTTRDYGYVIDVNGNNVGSWEVQ